MVGTLETGGAVLALDLGTKCGWAVGPRPIISGVWNLQPGRFEGGGIRFLKMRGQLIQIFDAMSVQRVAYEEVRRHAGTDAAHVYGGLQAMVTALCEERGLPYEAIPVGTIKRYWTGRGNANKAEMIAEAERRGFKPLDDNEADALAILHLVLADAGVLRIAA